jgi:glycerol-3-phosphate dehydrogenase
MVYDAIVIGSGVVGSAVARELMRYRLSVAVLERELDVGFGTSSRNTGVIHGGFNYATGTLKARCCVEGCRDFDRVAAELGIPFKRTGKVLVGFNDRDAEELEKAKKLGEANGVAGLEIIGEKRLHELTPHVTGTVAMWSPASGIVNPFLYTIALAENARANGAEFFFDREVTGAVRVGEVWKLSTKNGEFSARWVINCAGLGAVKISEMLGITGHKLGAFKGEYIILDNRLGHMLDMPVYPVPNPITGMGIHVTPTMDGNILVGPDSQLFEDTDDMACSQAALDYLEESGRKLFPSLDSEDFIRSFAGSRAKLVDPATGAVLDFVVESPYSAPGVVNLVGIESPGLTSALPLARRAVALVDGHEKLKPRGDFNPVRKAPVCFAEEPPEEKNRLIAENPDYGEIICRCEQVTRAEVLLAIRSIFGTPTLTGVKNRVRATMGRCQGGYCQMRISDMIERERGVADVRDVLHARPGGNMFAGKVRE